MPAAPQPNGAYDRFAWCYSRGWGEDFHHQARAVLEGHVFPLLPERARILDLCCGTGDLSALLVQHGYLVTGIDGSQEMLRYARERVPGAEFLLADARSFSFDAAFDSVLSTFDSLNHILSLEQLEAVFTNVRRALLPGGLFVFDLNMREAFETLWRGSSACVEDNAVSVTRGSWDPVERIGRAEITVFRRDSESDLWRRSDVCVPEKCYSPEEVLGSLDRTGFSGIEARDAYEVGMRTDIAVGRTFFFACKPSA